MDTTTPTDESICDSDNIAEYIFKHYPHLSYDRAINAYKGDKLMWNDDILEILTSAYYNRMDVRRELEHIATEYLDNFIIECEKAIKERLDELKEESK